MPPGKSKSRIIPAIISLLRQDRHIKQFDIIFANKHMEEREKAKLLRLKELGFPDGPKLKTHSAE